MNTTKVWLLHTISSLFMENYKFILTPDLQCEKGGKQKNRQKPWSPSPLENNPK